MLFEACSQLAGFKDRGWFNLNSVCDVFQSDLLFVFRAFEAYKTIQIAAPARVCGFLPSAIYKLDKLSEVILLAFTMSGGSSSVLQACSATFEA